MRVLVDIPDNRLRELGKLCEAENLSRAAAIREAIDAYLTRRRRKTDGDAFGLWGKRKMDGLKYQEKLRREW